MRLFRVNHFEIDERNYVVVHYWPQTDRNSAGHISLEIVCDGIKHHVSYWHQRDIAQCEKDKLKTQYDGIQPFWVEKFEEDCLIEGYRHACVEAPKLNARDILQKISETQFRGLMQPTQSIKLFSLDTQKMLKAFSEYKQSEHKWAFFAGHRYHAIGAHNCSSIVLHLLHEGGIESLIPSYSESLRNIALIISAIAALIWSVSTVQLFGIILLSGLAGSAIGGAVDGYNDIQPFMRVLNISKRDSFSAKCGITLGAVFASALQAMLFEAHYAVSRFTLPGNVLEMAMQAAQSEISVVNQIKQPDISHASKKL